MTDWYWMQNGQKHGPIDTTHLKQLARDGKLSPTDMIWREGLQEWVPASQAKGLEFVLSDNAKEMDAHNQAASRGIIKYHCAFCKTTLKSEGHFAGKQDTCPQCGKTTGVPLYSTVGAGAFFHNIPKSSYIGGAVVILVAIISLTTWFVLHDTWEQDHKTELRQMSEETVSLINSGKTEESVAKYEAMIALIGDRQLNDASLSQSVSNAKKMAVSLYIPKLESQAKAFIKNGDHQRGIDKYKQALNLIHESQTDKLDVDAIGRIAFAKMLATALLVKKRRANGEFQKHQEEQKKASVHGGAWVKKTIGNSTTLRGLHIFAVKFQGNNEQLISLFQVLLAQEQSKLSSEKADMDASLKYALDRPNSQYFQENYADSKLKVIQREAHIKSIKQKISDVFILGGTKPIDMSIIYQQLPRKTWYKNDIRGFLNDIYRIETYRVWATICTLQLAGTAYTDVDGKYELKLPEGDYYLYANFGSSYSWIEWFIPVHVNDTGSVKIDFYNDNATFIKNKNN